MAQIIKPEYFMTDEEKRALICTKKGISAKIDSIEHSELRVIVVAGCYAVYMNPEDKVYVMDIRTKEFLEEHKGLQVRDTLMNEIIEHGKEYDYGVLYVDFYKRRHFNLRAKEEHRATSFKNDKVIALCGRRKGR